MSQLTPSDSHVIQVARPRTSLFSSDLTGGGTSLLQKILDPLSKGFSSQAISPGVKEHPLNLSSVKALSLANEHHAICIRTFCACVAGLGFDSPTVALLGARIGSAPALGFDPARSDLGSQPELESGHCGLCAQ
jgi:hypothetical protein